MFLKGDFFPFKANSPYENMAIDEFLISRCLQSGVPQLRLYSWNPAGISLGKYQDAEKDINIDACLEDKIPIVRRLTGGGAIFHGGELTYSLVCSEEDIDCKGEPVKKTFEKLNSFIMLMYKKFGLDPAYGVYARPEESHGQRAGFCFSGTEEYDIIIDGKKIGGNAQARVKGLIFQHGSLPLAGSEEHEKYFKCPVEGNNYTCLNALLKRPVAPLEAAANMSAAFMESFNCALEPADFTMEEKKEVIKLLTGKYASFKWNMEGKL